MVNLNPSIGEGQSSRHRRSSFYYDVLKKSGKLKQPDSILRNKTSSYDKHFQVHTDITGSGRGNSYPHRKDFAWNLLYLKQSWGANLNVPKNQAATTTTTSSTNLATSRTTSNSGRYSKPYITKPRTAPDQSLPPLKSRVREEIAPSSVPDTIRISGDQRKRRNTGSERSRINLDSIPENEPLKSSSSRALTKESSSKVRQVIIPDQRASRRSRRSDSKISQYTATSYSSSFLSSQLPRLESRVVDSATPSNVSTSQSFRRDSRASSQASRSTRWDEHEGRPLAEKLFAERKMERQGKVVNTIKPEVLKTLVSAVTEELNSRHTSSAHLESKEVGSALSSGYTVKKHQPFTNLKFEVEKSAGTTRLRSSLYKTEEALRKPTIFRSNLTENRKQKKFNPRYHGDVTRPAMVDKHSHKLTHEGFTPAKWVPKLNDVHETKGPWTTYETVG